MNIKQLRFYIDNKRLGIGIFGIFLLLLLMGIYITISMRNDFDQLTSLIRSNYDYSSITQHIYGQDEYYYFENGISFSTSEDTQSGLNADVIMQTEDSKYTDLVNWNTNKLNINEVAISKGLARNCHLKAGDHVWLKSVIDGDIHEYTIRSILPGIKGIRITGEKIFTDGVIVMGFDKTYVDNVSHLNVVFAKNGDSSKSESNVVYRKDEIKKVLKSMVPLLVIHILLSVSLVIVINKLITDEIRFNFNRMMMIGLDRSLINKSFNRTIMLWSVIPIVSLYAILLIISVFSDVSVLESGYLFLTFILSILALFISSYNFRNWLWRGH